MHLLIEIVKITKLSDSLKYKMAKKHSSYTQNKDIIGSPIDDEMVMMDVDKGSYFGLNSMGSEIWNSIEEPKTIQELVDELIKEYEISEDECKTEVTKFIDALVDVNLIIKSK